MKQPCRAHQYASQTKLKHMKITKKQTKMDKAQQAVMRLKAISEQKRKELEQLENVIRDMEYILE